MIIASAFDALAAKVQNWGTDFIAMLPEIGMAIAVVIAAWYAGKTLSRVAESALNRVVHAQSIASLLATIGRVAVFLVGLFVALGLVGLDKTVTSMLAGVGIIGLALGFAFQDIAANFVSGVLLALRRPFEIGDTVEVDGEMGTVERINLRSTEVKSFTGQVIIIPNKDVFGNKIVNFSSPGCRRIDVPVGVGYDSDLAEVMEVTREALQPMADRCSGGKPVSVILTGFGGSSIDVMARVWIDDTSQKNYLDCRTEAIQAINSAYQKHNINIPYPIRTLQLDQGDAWMKIARRNVDQGLSEAAADQHNTERNEREASAGADGEQNSATRSGSLGIHRD